MSNKGKKKGPRPSQVVRRGEVAAPFQNVANDIGNLRLAQAWIADLLIEKGIFTLDELKAYFEKKTAETKALITAQEAQCSPATSSQPSSTPITV